jgi:hypothetical protein
VQRISYDPIFQSIVIFIRKKQIKNPFSVWQNFLKYHSKSSSSSAPVSFVQKKALKQRFVISVYYFQCKSLEICSHMVICLLHAVITLMDMSDLAILSPLPLQVFHMMPCQDPVAP